MQSTQDDMGTQNGEISLRDYIDLLRRRKRIFFQTFFVVLALGAAITFATKPMYRAESRILVEGRALALAQYNTGDPLSNLFMPDVGHDVATQTEVLQGDKVLMQAYHDADVPGDAARVDVKQVSSTDVITIGVNSTNKAYAERLVKALPATYIKFTTGNTSEEVANALTFARNREEDEERRLGTAELALQRFKERQKVTNVDQERTAQIGAVATTDADLKKAKADVDSARARMEALQTAKAAEKETIDAKTIVTNPRIEQLKAAINALNTQRSSGLILHKENSVEIQGIDAQIKTLQGELASAPATVTTTSQTRNPERSAYDVRIADARATLASLTAAYTNAQDRAARAKIGIGRYSGLERRQIALQREIEQRQATVQQLKKSVLDLSLRQTAMHPPIHVISNTEQAQLIAPLKGRNLAYAAAVGIVLALCFSLLQEFMDDRIHTPEDARKILGVPVLGYIPMVENEANRLLVKARSNGSLLESYRVLRSNVQFATVDSPASSLMVTSSVPSEGKSTTSANLAVAMALDGRRVILVDADLRRPTLHTKLGLNNSAGMTNVMLGQFTLDEALQDTNIPNLKLLSAGTLPPNPAELLHSQTMVQLHEALKDRADMVIFDSPPALATADAQVLSAEVDGVIYIVQAGEARKSGVRHAGELLAQAHARLLGVVLNKLEVGSNRDSYYGYYGYYSAKAIEDDKNETNGNGKMPRQSGGNGDKLLPRGETGVTAVARQHENGSSRNGGAKNNHSRNGHDSEDAGRKRK